jgi:hypothetical protein
VREERLYVVGEPPDLYLEMLGEPEEVGYYLRMPDLEDEECFLRIFGLLDTGEAWVN